MNVHWSLMHLFFCILLVLRLLHICMLCTASAYKVYHRLLLMYISYCYCILLICSVYSFRTMGLMFRNLRTLQDSGSPARGMTGQVHYNISSIFPPKLCKVEILKAKQSTSGLSSCTTEMSVLFCCLSRQSNLPSIH